MSRKGNSLSEMRFGNASESVTKGISAPPPDRLAGSLRMFARSCNPWPSVETKGGALFKLRRMLTSIQKEAPHDNRSSEQLQVTVMRAELAAQIDRLTGGVDGLYDTAVPRFRLARV